MMRQRRWISWRLSLIMGRIWPAFVTDLLQHLRDLLIVRAGGENTHNSDLFAANLEADQARLCLIDQADDQSSGYQKIVCNRITLK